jgi:hypothetical protein
MSLGASSSCTRGVAKDRPVASLADTTAASRSFEHIRVAWARNDPGDRLRFRSELDSFVRTFPADGLAPLAGVYGVLSLMDPPADWARAQRRLADLPPLPPGATHDLYVVASAKLLRYHHQPEAAFELLRPIIGKMLDGRARELLQEELTFDALEAHEPFEAIAYMDAWLRGATEEDREHCEAKVAVALGAVPETVLRESLRVMRTGAQGAELRGYSVAIQRLIAGRLGQVAVERGDVALARWLLDPEAAAPLLGDEVSGALGQLATSTRGIGSVVGRTVGLVLPTSSAALRGEAAEALRGVLWGLGGAAGQKSTVRLVIRDDGGDAARLDASLEEVAGEGASVIITALDSEAATRALAWGTAASLDVIALATPGQAGGEVPAGFSVGEDWPAEFALLAAALDVTAGQEPAVTPPGGVVTLADRESLPRLSATQSALGSVWRAPVPCDVEPSRAGQSRFPFDTWSKAGVQRWLVAGAPACADDLLAGMRRYPHRATVALSLEAADARVRPPGGVRLVAATAGIVPLASADPSDPRVKELRGMAGPSGRGVGWWAALGHDAAVLANSALKALPPDTTADSDEIARRRARVHRALVDARVPLWTTEQSGFDETLRLPRTVRVVEVGR